ncbi:MAG: ACP S-malonyltransferase [Deltaproteobacteria bacterium]|jgi:[acyl-carrier-protein] S-malonyltransferase|nr:ACP S-malonyltransferase [Deltaproteobacteria bacterium]
MTKTAFIFPGQGGQYVGQAADWLERDEEAASLFSLAEEITQKPLKKLCLEGPIEELSKTSNLQPAVLAVSMAASFRLIKQGSQPDYAAGHSLGEFGALVLAKVISAKEAFALITRRAELMQKASEDQSGCMSAVLNLPAKTVEAICELARNEGQIAAANFNAPLQTVISGQPRAVAAAKRYAELKGGKIVPLQVSGAFHSPLMAAAALSFEKDLDQIEFKTPIFPVVPNSLGRPVSDAPTLLKYLKTQMISPVRWTETISGLISAGVSEFLECWPKPYLASIIKKNLSSGSTKIEIKSTS